MSDKQVSVKVGPNFFGLLAIVFITLKLTGYITWSWWWVLAPIWGPIAILFGIVAIILIIGGIAGGLK